VDFEWRRLGLIVVVAGGLWAAGELLLPTAGAVGLLTRAAVVAAVPAVLLLTGFLSPEERLTIIGLKRIRSGEGTAR